MLYQSGAGESRRIIPVIVLFHFMMAFYHTMDDINGIRNDWQWCAFCQRSTAICQPVVIACILWYGVGMQMYIICLRTSADIPFPAFSFEPLMAGVPRPNNESKPN